ncbi:hypothetical protein WA026_013493 [Henosepilachna vigintioctopunctata]|uniref:Reverse transcriptase n=1 Tax=Henosepilachna vigintioctopunctata TaxID=420089 RepID=A0AAW1V666_9CUCU
MSGVSHRSILDPFLYLLNTSDLPRHIVSKSEFYANDTKVYRNLEQDHGIIQADLNIITKWLLMLLPLNVEKCVVLHLEKTTQVCSTPFMAGFSRWFHLM